MQMRVPLVIVVLGFGLVPNILAQDAAAVIDASAKAMGSTTLQSIQYSGTGTNNSVGQAFTSGGPWPRYKVTKYVGSINFTVPAMRQEIVRIDNERPPRGGGAGGFNPATGQGGIRPVPGDIIQNQNTDGRTEVGALNIWLTPHGFLKGAAANASTAKVSGDRGKRIVSFTAFGKYTVTGHINAQNLVEHVETRIDGGFTGDTVIEGNYSDYKDFGGVKFPMKIELRQGGFPTLELVVADVQPNSPAASAIAGNPQRGGAGAAAGTSPAAEPRVQPDKIAEGVWGMNFGNERSVLVEFKDHLVLVEAPGGDAQSMATMAEAKRMFPNKPIRYVVNSHHHSDHAGGIRTYVAEGIPIITHESHKRYYEQQVFKNPHTLNPDRLARMPRPPMIEAVTDKRVLTDGSTTLEVHLLRGNFHSEGLLVAYIPKERILIQSDAFVQRPGAPPLPAPSPFTVNLVETVERLKLNVDRVVHIHGGSDSWDTVLKTAGR
jgi:glyoxylase-like metal-dependent hydrolase (beta-lactamase superfamily II)